MDKQYDHNKYEQSLYKKWEDEGAFKPSKDGEPFSIIMPPPNANGDLHMGHALMLTVEDIMSRHARSQGKSVLWLPGADHAGFETQVVYEKKLAKEGRSRLSMERDQLYKEIWDFTKTNQKNMEDQIRRLGSSCDWSRLKFTLDQDIIDTVYKTFQKLIDDKLAYRGVRLVNFCPKFATSFSDLEVVHEEQAGTLTHILYPFVDGETDGQKGITVATTRPETMLGDMAVAVNPTDKRYTKLVGKQVKLPLTDRTIPIITDDIVDKKFGTGAVKVTPAHDFNDFAIGERNGLKLLQVIGFDGKLNDHAPEKYRGLNAAITGREAVVADLKEQGAIVKEESHLHQVPMGYKGGRIEPLPLKQWFIKMDKFAAEVKTLIEQDEITIYPTRYKKILFNWLDNIQDWNISRQIVWGIPIPVYYCANENCSPIVSTEEINKCPDCGGSELTKETDTFDTWFSSGQWVFATLGYDPETGQGSDDFNKFMPTSVMETAADIIFFWVFRMIFMTKYVTGKIPFKHVYLHGLVLDPKGQKMSKSKGNVLNPIEMIDKYGTDALRFALVVGNVAGSNQPFSEDKVRAGRNFANKLWNMGRFIEMKAGKLDLSVKKPEPETEADKAILQKLDELKTSYETKMPEYKYWLVAEELYHFAWHEFADTYIEESKQQESDNTNQILSYVYGETLRLLSPIMPFITDYLLNGQTDTK